MVRSQSGRALGLSFHAFKLACIFVPLLVQPPERVPEYIGTVESYLLLAVAKSTGTTPTDQGDVPVSYILST